MQKIIAVLTLFFHLNFLTNLSVCDNIGTEVEVQQDQCNADDQTCIEKLKIERESINQGIKIARGSNLEGRPPPVTFDECTDRHKNCVQYEGRGECHKNPGWMIVHCAKSCNACHLRDAKVRCQRSALNISTEPIYKPGDLNWMFANIAEEFPHFGITVISTDPWIVTFDNFLSDEEIHALISTNEGKWERSTDSGTMNEFGETGRKLSTGRTSSNAWCRHECLNNPHVQNVMNRIEEVTKVPKNHYENFQVLQYDIGQRYNTHHDMSERQVKLTPGPRILTFFLYLSDVEEGGETAFPQLGYEVKPRKGKALLWPSVMDDNLEQQDPRTNHEAKAVIRGKKYAANAWIHLYDYRVSNLWGCTGTFD
mmetsp:Transcript_9811/g.13483  ORF Transcript_9811/g.13483 Transcript_9811/m.13483 type:complete len:367 (-) Transcript_9811:88-1188(-)|eukprot:CAMPEP_0170119458 /NCGR_PEP_ID=MMETSP0020_2-20130122/14407_1 /TAXON_ID=98059 /ORGANISM="Dinobryon sp., Strain UTEXLB2267" /LENGTH=366 /DNA_ID=CAMNT_0010348831 /DNA_START=57 /DNA_END=1157 /DNA_ORIENTATION=+